MGWKAIKIYTKMFTTDKPEMLNSLTLPNNKRNILVQLLES